MPSIANEISLVKLALKKLMFLCLMPIGLVIPQQVKIPPKY